MLRFLRLADGRWIPESAARKHRQGSATVSRPPARVPDKHVVSAVRPHGRIALAVNKDSSGKRPVRPRFHKAYSFGLVTGAFFLVSWLGQFLFQMFVVRNEAEQHGQGFTWSEFLPQFFSSTFENWQSEFLQLVWQAAGLALFYFWGSSQSKESDERLEAKIDALLKERDIDPMQFEYEEEDKAEGQQSGGQRRTGSDRQASHRGG